MRQSSFLLIALLVLGGLFAFDRFHAPAAPTEEPLVTSPERPGGGAVDELGTVAVGSGSAGELSERAPVAIPVVDAAPEELGRVAEPAVVVPGPASIAGRLTGWPAGGLEGVHVRAIPAAGTSREAAVLPNGEFQIEGCEAGLRHRIFAHVGAAARPEQLKLRSSVVPAKGGDWGLALPWIAATGVSFRVVDEAGQALDQFTVRYGLTHLNVLGGAAGVGAHYPEGRVVIEDLPRDPKHSRGAELRVTVDAVGRASVTRRIRLEAGQVVDAGALALGPAGVLRVRVLDAGDGRPVVGAEVVLRIEEAVHELAALGPGPQQRQGRTGPDGVARLTLFAETVGQLEVRSSNHAPAQITNLAMPATGDLERELRLGLGGRVRVLVKDAIGSPLAGVAVDSHGAAPGSSTAQIERALTGPSGFALFEHLAPGAHAFSFQGAVGGTVEVKEGGEYDLALQGFQPTTLAGLLSEAGQLLGNAELSLYPLDPNRPMPFQVETLNAQSNAQGAFAFPEVRPGTWRLRVEHPSRAMAFQVEVKLTPGENQFNLDLPLTAVAGRVVDSRGQPIEGVQVEVVPIEADVARTATTNATGHFLLRGIEADSNLRLRARRTDLGSVLSKPFSVPVGTTYKDLVIELKSQGRLRLKVEGPQQGLVITVQGHYLGDLPGIAPATGATTAGELLLSPLTPGPWEFRLTLFNGDGRPGPAPQTIQVNPAEEALLVFQL